ncbi:transposase [Desulfococcaceae bacterium HSG7]|nr:transposase [Desulfococcaceae bacterium HSG7]
MKAKKESSGKNPSEELIALMSGSIFITTIRTEKFTFGMILKLYGLRWRIENIFKTWKSHFSFSKIHNVSEKRLRVLLTARLTMITFIYHGLFKPLSMEIRKISKKRLSLMKFTRYIRKNIEIIFKLADIRNIREETLPAIIRYRTYDLRRRIDFETGPERIILELNFNCRLT